MGKEKDAKSSILPPISHLYCWRSLCAGRRCAYGRLCLRQASPTPTRWHSLRFALTPLAIRSRSISQLLTPHSQLSDKLLIVVFDYTEVRLTPLDLASIVNCPMPVNCQLRRRAKISYNGRLCHHFRHSIQVGGFYVSRMSTDW